MIALTPSQWYASGITAAMISSVVVVLVLVLRTLRFPPVRESIVLIRDTVPIGLVELIDGRGFQGSVHLLRSPDGERFLFVREFDGVDIVSIPLGQVRCIHHLSDRASLELLIHPKRETSAVEPSHEEG